MIFFRKPSANDVAPFLARQAALEFSYKDVGATATMPPAGYNLDRTRVRLGEGQGIFDSAKAALHRWEQFNLGWVQAWSPDGSLKVGDNVAVAGKSLGLWWLNACRIVYVINDDLPEISRFGFAYGTLPAHAESGEERFLIEWDRATNIVWYDIIAFSQPRQFLARIGKPWVRRLQKQFGRDSGRAMINAVTLAR